jgi:hypothetical protein
MAFTRDEIMEDESFEEVPEEINLTATEPVRIKWSSFTLEQLRGMEKMSFFPTGKFDDDLDITMSKWLEKTKTTGRWEILMQSRNSCIFYKMEATQHAWILTFSKRGFFISLILMPVEKVVQEKLFKQPFDPETNCRVELANYFYLSERNTSAE